MVTAQWSQSSNKVEQQQLEEQRLEKVQFLSNLFSIRKHSWATILYSPFPHSADFISKNMLVNYDSTGRWLRHYKF